MNLGRAITKTGKTIRIDYEYNIVKGLKITKHVQDLYSGKTSFIESYSIE